MNRICAGICLAAVAAASAANARAEGQDIKAQVQAIYGHIGKAVEKKDIAGVIKYSLPDATVKYADGTELTLKEWKERAKKGWTHIKQTKSRFIIQEAKADGRTAVATYTEVHAMLISDPTDVKEHKVGYQAKWQVTLKLTTAGWRLSRSVELERRVTRDGKLIDQRPNDKSKPS